MTQLGGVMCDKNENICKTCWNDNCPVEHIEKNIAKCNDHMDYSDYELECLRDDFGRG